MFSSSETTVSGAFGVAFASDGPAKLISSHRFSMFVLNTRGFGIRPSMIKLISKDEMLRLINYGDRIFLDVFPP